MKNMIEIPTAELKAALTGLGKVVNKRAVLPSLQTIRVARDNLGIVSLQGTAKGVRPFPVTSSDSAAGRSNTWRRS